MKLSSLLYFLAGALCTGIVGALLLSSVQPIEQTKVSTQDTSTVTPHPPSELSRQQKEVQNPNGPWSGNLYAATSEDGTTFGESALFIERAGVPSIIRDANDRLVAAFQWFPEQDEGWDQVAVVSSQDDGETWSEPVSIRVEGLPEDYQRPFDPTLTLLEDGRIRLYFTSSQGQPGPSSSMQIYSAISTDGITYTFEEGIRHALEDWRAYDVAVARLGTYWHLMSPVPDGASHRTGTDGLVFSDVETISSTQRDWTGNLIQWEDGLRFYGGGSQSIWWSFSEDGSTWSELNPTNTRGGDPGLVRLNDGSLLMIFVSKPTE